MESQRVMQKLQPELKALQEKYKDDKEKLAQETMAFWKKHKVNPFGSCLPLLIQLPIVLAIFYAVQNGLDVASSYLLYEPLKNVNMQHVQTLFISLPFYTLDLALKEPFVLPAVVGLLQFVQMKLALPKLKAAQKKPTQDGMPDMQMVNQTMTYVLPLMLAFMAATIPAGVGLYWGVNTIFGIVQQFVVNKEKRLSAKNI
jgi:YidC/Oxa1 family membrane protein insertase